MADNVFTRTPTNPLVVEKTPQQKCKERGGKWDGEKCIMPEKVEDQKDTSTITTKIGGKDVVLRPGETAGGVTYEGRDIAGARTAEIGRMNEERIKAGLEPLTPEQAPQSQLGEILQKEQQEESIEAERERLTTEEAPVRRELDPNRTGLEELPVLGPAAKKIFDLIPFLDDEAKTEVALQPEILRTAALTEIERQEIERGLSASEEFGTYIESIPIIGGLVSKYASGLIETPSGNTKEVVSNIRKERRRISNIETNVKLGYLPVVTAQEQITDIEENVQRLESRVKLLIQNSPQLKFNSDGVNTIETEILTTNEKIFQAKQNILTGQSQDPLEIQLLQKMEELAEEEE